MRRALGSGPPNLSQLRRTEFFPRAAVLFLVRPTQSLSDQVNAAGVAALRDAHITLRGPRTRSPACCPILGGGFSSASRWRGQRAGDPSEPPSESVLSPAEVEALQRADFYSFMVRCFAELHIGRAFSPAWRAEVLAAKLQGVREGPVKRLVVNVPRHLKSLAASVALPAWLLGHDPTLAIVKTGPTPCPQSRRAAANDRFDLRRSIRGSTTSRRARSAGARRAESPKGRVARLSISWPGSTVKSTDLSCHSNALAG